MTQVLRRDHLVLDATEMRPQRVYFVFETWGDRLYDLRSHIEVAADSKNVIGPDRIIIYELRFARLKEGGLEDQIVTALAELSTR